MSKLTIEQLELAGKRVFLRADLNAPLAGGEVSDDTRLRAVLPTIRYALTAGAAVVLASHLGRPKGKVSPRMSLKPVGERLRIEKRPACHLAEATRLGADGAMTVMLGVPRALSGAERAFPDAGVQQPVNDDVV